ncbi:MAG TPA: hypothetical protein VNH38_01530 [Candidatus Dormibacteraeota bacterium]|nr:hypothetical protein [Candidatus Dormibacteraeota bacterium]
MPPITALPLLALLFPAAATLVCSALGRPWPRRPAVWARWVMRVGLLLALADAVTILFWLQAGGTLQSTLWRLEPRLPITLSVGTSGAVLAVMVLVAALVVSFAARDRRPLASAALGLAVLGAVGAAFAGDLLSLYIGLQLSALGGIGLSYARQPRAASSRMVWAAVADQAIGLVWLGSMLVLLHRTATLQLSAIPTSNVGPALVGVLLLPAAVRLAGCGLIAGSATPGRPGSTGRSLDVADWLTVVAVPTALLLLIRVQALSGGTWPAPWFGTGLDLLAVLMGMVAVAGLLASSNPQSGLRSLLLVLGALVIVGFGQNSSDGTLLGLTAGLFLEVSVSCLPRALLGSVRGRSPIKPRPTRRGKGAQLRPSAMVMLIPCLLGFGVAFLGLDLALRGGLEVGSAPALAYLFALAGLVLAIPRLRRAVTLPTGWSWPLWLPALCLGAAAILPGWSLTVAAAALAPPGTTGLALLSAPDPLVILAPGLLWPGGYLVLLVGLVAGGGWALRLATGARPATSENLALAPTTPVVVLPERLAGLVVRASSAPSWTREVRGWYSILVALADREVAERPVWLWVAATAAAAWLLAEVVKL